MAPEIPRAARENAALRDDMAVSEFWHRLNRRRFLRMMAAAAAAKGLPRFARAADAPAYPFSEVVPSSSGIRWVHTAGKSKEKYLPEISGAGCAFLDYDNDGWMDIYLVNSGKADFYTPPTPLRNALYRNNRDGTFTDVTEKAGVGGGGYGMGVAVGDYNGDGFPDIYVTQYDRSILYRNNGDGTFTDVTEKAGVAAPGWASSAVWFDYDNDGHLDLFVCQFADYDKLRNHVCGDPTIPGVAGMNEYCYPKVYDPLPSWLFHNNGDGTFTDVSQKMGISEVAGKAWGVVATDINNDGWMDLFVSNDTVANFLFANRGGKHFEEIGFTSGVGYGEGGKIRSGMGVDSADFDQDGWQDLIVTNLDHEMYSIYRNTHNEAFEDKATAFGFAKATELMSGWGVKFFDYDNDGNLDLMIANGHPNDLIDKIKPGVTFRESLLLFHNTGKELKNVSAESGPVFTRQMASRGLALGDFNNDGAIDVLISNNDEPPLLLRNEAGTQNNWLGIRLVGKKSNIDAIGARVSYQAGDLKRTATKVGGGGFLSSHDPRVVLGIGKRTKIDWIEVKWPQPSGATERFTNPPINRYITILEGEGKWK
ncbi:MAG TPA: CRTAC1 family protein [Candidatus Sulfotelmatobacter sp.]|nr:CRTAC1 family protein [Candidatus Sulfotelmatobacter sp.]